MPRYFKGLRTQNMKLWLVFNVYLFMFIDFFIYGGFE